METQKPTLEIGKKFLAFWVNRVIGRGGIGEVYEITNKGKHEALKVIQAKWLGEESLARRMVDEGELLVGIKHPNVVEVHETGITPEGQVWIRMELLVGETLREVMNRRELMSVALACTYMRSAGHAAHQCHVIGAVHRDIKPENLFITNPDEIVKLLDFGIAKLYGSPDTADGQRHGTPLYMAPEQIRGHRVTPATDVYALGLVTYELLCGANPFVDDPRAYDLYTLYYKHFSEIPAPLTSIGIPQEISDVVAKALAKDPKERYQSGHAFAEALWGAWCTVREREPDWDTEPGEPTKEELMQRADDGLFYGTGPSEGRRPSAPSDARPSRTSGPSRISLVHRAVERAKTEPLPNVPREPEALVAFLAERASKAPPAPRAATEKLPEVASDPSPGDPDARVTLPAATPVRLASVVALAAHPRWVPVQTTVPLAAARAEARAPAHAQVAAPALTAHPMPEPEPWETAVTQPYLPRAQPAAPLPKAEDPEPRASGPRARAGGWAEAPDMTRAGLRPVPGMNVRAGNPRRAGTFALPEPLAAGAHRARASRRGGRLLGVPHERLLVVVALASIVFVSLFLALHITRARRATAPGPEATGPAAAPGAAGSASASSSPTPSQVASSLPRPASSAPEPTRTASIHKAPPAPSQPSPKPRRRDGEVVDPWAR